MVRFDEELKPCLHRDLIGIRMGINGQSTLLEQAIRLNLMASMLFVSGDRYRQMPLTPANGFADTSRSSINQRN